MNDVAEPFHFDDLSIVRSGMKLNVSFGRFSRQFAEAQRWLGEQVLTDCKPEMPHVTGTFQGLASPEHGGKQVVFGAEYARFLYEGVLMVDSETGSPYSPSGGHKIVTDTPLNYAAGGDHWFEVAKEKHGEEWVQGVKKLAGGG